MYVYKFKINASYGGGEAIVAARSALEAFGLVCKEKSYIVEHINADEAELLVDLSCDYNEPKLISCEYYIE